MSVDASGKGASDMQADMDAAENARIKGNSDMHTESAPAYR
jgi:hypothetical protein